jgi:hypothetical protein
MTENIKCPNCGHEFEPTDVVREEIKKELNIKAEEWRKKLSKEFAEEKVKLQQQLADEKIKAQQQIEESLRKRITSDYENKLNLLQQEQKENLEKLKEARQKEAEYLRKEMDLKNREAEIDITVQKQLQRDREKLTEDIRKIEEQKVAAKETEYQLRMKELEKQLDDQKKLAEEMRRKAEQGSSQLQGEVQELALEEMLRTAFPFDVISEVGKGKRGADCIQTVRNNFGQECGKIIYESKRATSWGTDWIEKLKADMRANSADIAVIVTRTMPKDMDCFGIKDGVWICSFSEVKPMAAMLRDGVMRVYAAAKTHDNRGDKMQLLYDYLLSNEFAEQWKAIREGFASMKMSIQKEREAMERLWKAREKQLEKVLLSAAHIRGSIEGIAGQNAVNLELMDDSTNLLEEGE